mmetsp:Transcript_49433/g.105240  ORF Transcript_49433/g.105240 Transcript_49433/m.105240 type:complete len:120 (+) Transcript_49433:1045-1404(+)
MPVLQKSGWSAWQDLPGPPNHTTPGSQLHGSARSFQGLTWRSVGRRSRRSRNSHWGGVACCDGDGGCFARGGGAPAGLQLVQPLEPVIFEKKRPTPTLSKPLLLRLAAGPTKVGGLKML